MQVLAVHLLVVAAERRLLGGPDGLLRPLGKFFDVHVYPSSMVV